MGGRNGDITPPHSVTPILVCGICSRSSEMGDNIPPNSYKGEMVVPKLVIPDDTIANLKSSASATSQGENKPSQNPPENASQTETSWPKTATDGYNTKHSFVVAPGNNNVN